MVFFKKNINVRTDSLQKTFTTSKLLDFNIFNYKLN